MNKALLSCGQAKGKHCEICKHFNGKSSGTIICPLPRCDYKFSLVQWIWINTFLK